MTIKPAMLARGRAGLIAILLGWATLPGNVAADLRTELLAIEPGGNLAGTATVQPAGIESFRQIVANAPRRARARFTFGKIQFNTEWDPAPGDVPANDGLGPVFNAIACASCHINNGRGSPPTSAADPLEALLVRLSMPGTDNHGGPLPLSNYGDQLQHRAINGVKPEGTAVVEFTEIPGQFADGTAYTLRKPSVIFTDLQFGALPADFMYSLRLANPVVGLGLLEAIPDSALEQLADPDDSNQDGISGRINRVWSKTLNSESIGRFGWKANVASVAEQNAGAALGDMGITTRIHPTDNCMDAQTKCRKAAAEHADELEFRSDFFDQLTRYVRLLGVPAQREPDSTPVQAGAQLFAAIGCVQCHIPTLKTSETAIHPELANQTIHPYTDLLLHDMGEGLADGRPDYLASGREWRTAPLWGIGLTATVSGAEFYLHDGRARNLTEAILWHGGEARTAREAFSALPAESRSSLIKFLQSL